MLCYFSSSSSPFPSFCYRMERVREISQMVTGEYIVCISFLCYIPYVAEAKKCTFFPAVFSFYCSESVHTRLQLSLSCKPLFLCAASVFSYIFKLLINFWCQKCVHHRAVVMIYSCLTQMSGNRVSYHKTFRSFLKQCITTMCLCCMLHTNFLI